MQELWITTNPLDEDCWSTHQVEDCRPFLVDYFKGKWPPSAKIYHNEISESSDVTPKLPTDHERLATLNGRIYVIVYPAAAPVIIGIVAIVAITALSFIFKPENIKTPRESVQGSPNNLLGKRVNDARVNGRIPDIYGKVRAYPDLIQQPYRTFRNNREIENLYMCVGRGSFDIETDSVRDGETPLSRITGTKVAFYNPNTSPNSGSPFLTSGGTIGTPLIKIIRMNEVDGQSLVPEYRINMPSSSEFSSKTANTLFNFDAPDLINVDPNANKKLGDFFIPGQSVTITGAQFGPFVGAGIPFNTGGISGLDLDGTYIIAEVIDDSLIRLDDPGSVNSDWNLSFGAAVGRRIFSSLGTAFNTLKFAFTVWNGPFLMNVDDAEEVWCNFISPQGLYIVDGQNQFGVRAEIEVGITPCDEFGDATGLESFYTTSMTGSYTLTSTIATTFKITLAEPGPHLIRARFKEGYLVRSDGGLESIFVADPSFPAWHGTLFDDVQWLDCYAVTSISAVEFPHFGDVTTCQAEIMKTPQSLAIKDRKFSCVVTRKLAHWNGTTFDTLAATRHAGDALVAMCVDNYIGRTFKSPFYSFIEFVDANTIFAALTTVQNYFGMSLVTNFDYTFDKSESSFEDLVGTVAAACFLVVYRLGGQITAHADIATALPTILCNHRNKIQGTEIRKVDFSSYNDNDGVEVDFVNTDTGVVSTYTFPVGGGFSNKHIDVLGITSREQAFWHGQRAYAKLFHQNTTLEFEMTHEIAYVAVKDKILIADSTRPITDKSPTDGEITNVEGLILTCSQPTNVMGAGSKAVFLQNDQGFVENIGCTTGPGDHDITLNFTPSFTINTDVNVGPRTKYIIALDADFIPRQFQLMEKTPSGPMTYSVKAVNLSPVTYIGDNIQVWLEPENTNFFDTGPHRQGRVVQGTPTVVFNGSGSIPRQDWVYESSTAGDRIDFVQPATATYTLIAWIKMPSILGNINSIIMSNDAGRSVIFRVNASGLLEGGHNNTIEVSTAYPDFEWNHVALRYNDATGIMLLYLNGVVMDVATGVPSHGPGGYGWSIGGTPASGPESLIGNIWWARAWSRNLSSEEIYDDFRTTRNRST